MDPLLGSVPGMSWECRQGDAGKKLERCWEFDRFGRCEGASLVLLDLGEMSILVGEMGNGRWER